MRVLRDAGAEIPKEMDRFPSTIKKKEHGVYGAFYKVSMESEIAMEDYMLTHFTSRYQDMSDAPAPKKIVFD